MVFGVLIALYFGLSLQNLTMAVEEAFIKVKGKYSLPYVHLKDEQIAILTALVEQSKHVTAVLPTGFGKSATFTLVPLLLDEVRKNNI